MDGQLLTGHKVGLPSVCWRLQDMPHDTFALPLAPLLASLSNYKTTLHPVPNTPGSGTGKPYLLLLTYHQHHTD